jgi:hypothetical protein
MSERRGSGRTKQETLGGGARNKVDLPSLVRAYAVARLRSSTVVRAVAVAAAGGA